MSEPEAEQCADSLPPIPYHPIDSITVRQARGRVWVEPDGTDDAFGLDADTAEMLGQALIRESHKMRAARAGGDAA